MHSSFTSREFNQNSSGAKKAARLGPVFITDRGKPAHVLLSIQEYQRLVAGRATLAEVLAQTEVEDFDFEAPRVGGLYRPADLT